MQKCSLLGHGPTRSLLDTCLVFALEKEGGKMRKRMGSDADLDSDEEVEAVLRKLSHGNEL